MFLARNAVPLLFRDASRRIIWELLYEELKQVRVDPNFTASYDHLYGNDTLCRETRILRSSLFCISVFI